MRCNGFKEITCSSESDGVIGKWSPGKITNGDIVPDLIDRAKVCRRINDIKVLSDSNIPKTKLESALCGDCEKERCRCYSGGYTRCPSNMVLFACNFVRISLIKLG